ncbi:MULTISPECIES: FadR/GntR family transcriptional regulator [unclassified Planococcus (in: firmicutes)]|uniref:FadR/GntR family transcriptional regulator n=1 Tax=Planococcus TaxID=1372 RepID=UPI000C7BEDF2|nr:MULTISPECIES: GntR family transcriptional regulator [unclassified Planococcus (in: firmicutes)]PKG46494.1 GntR family transcriptional regulator [Planococcus sp. Urea-trap-24]PKG89430.1 GntR family transcriptional regulator [Planococcus sp. Urea-3u-39]PKH41238.1 GntR family transcriptional regulator [Planococcus sp. MB-3u-09]
MNQPKRYLNIVSEMRDMIREQNIRPGDRIPSERELAEKLAVGRSTIREALRSLELLGLIETRRGEGTFLADPRKHRLVELLATFILQDNKTLEDVRETMCIHETAAIQAICASDASKLPVWESLRERLDGDEFIREDFVRELMVLSGNRLSLKIWFLLKQYGGNPYDGEVMPEERPLLKNILQAIEQQDAETAIREFKAWSSVLIKGENAQWQ